MNNFFILRDIAVEEFFIFYITYYEVYILRVLRKSLYEELMIIIV